MARIKIIIRSHQYQAIPPFLPEVEGGAGEGGVYFFKLKSLASTYWQVWTDFWLSSSSALTPNQPLSELQSKIVASELAEKWQRPANTRELGEKEAKKPHYHQITTPRHTITVDYHLFKKELKHVLKECEINKVTFLNEKILSTTSASGSLR